ncbi:MAG: MGMT family protein [Patescibacteria group bacterium]
MAKFKEKVVEIVRLIPYGKVASYGQVALFVGTPRAAIQVGSVLNKLEDSVQIPWWRVINNSGRISIKGSSYTPWDQKERLESEGIKVKENLDLDIEKYRWRPNGKVILSLKLSDGVIEKILGKYLT